LDGGDGRISNPGWKKTFGAQAVCNDNNADAHRAKRKQNCGQGGRCRSPTFLHAEV
jgi:hypothetical protein